MQTAVEIAWRCIKPMPHTILVVDDETAIVELLSYNLEKAHYGVLVARDGIEALRLARERRPDLVILDLMLPGLDGLEVCREIRKHGDTPIIMLTARSEEVDRVVGLELGADDYVVKPFSVRELMARIKTVLRRTKAQAQPSGGTLRAGDLSLRPQEHEVHWRQIPVELTPLEFDLLETLMQHAGQVLTREQLLSRVWGYDYHGDSRVVDSAIKRLRAKLRKAGAGSAPIATVRGVGYRLDRE
jgi:two-component system alkaline phosphatase synthesis response regulator PhoP